MNVKDYIKEHWDKTVRLTEKDEGTLIGLPCPYTVPSVKDTFQEMYYWDTYFTNVGLLRCGKENLAKSNADNFLYLVNRFGFIPNGSRTYYLKRSQPPYLAFAVSDVYDKFRDDEWLKNAYFAVKKEYDFWMTKRISPVGLNVYGDNGETAEDCVKNAEAVIARTGLKSDDSPERIGRNHFAEFESGWDCTPRFSERCAEHLPVDLNCNLYFYECFLDKTQKKSGIADGEDWALRAKRRKSLVQKYLFDKECGVYKDYDFVRGVHSAVISCASFQPFFTGLADEGEKSALIKTYNELSCKFGMVTTAKEGGNYQWAYPNGWAPLQYIAYVALKNYGFTEESRSVAERYTALVEKVFAETGSLWEKYNVIEGNVNVVNEYGLPEMMGWTAGVYEFFSSEIK